MKPTLTKTTVLHFIQAIWSTLVLTLFVFYTGKISHIYGSSLDSWTTFPQKFARIEPLSFTQNLFFAFTGIICFALGCISLGSIITSNLWNIKRPSITVWLCNLITAFLLGEILYSFILFGLGIAQKMTPTVNGILLIAILFAGAFNIKNILLSFQSINKDKNDSEISQTNKAILWISITIILSTLLFTSARLSYDSVAVYFSNAKLTAATHQIQSYVDDAFFISSFQTGILYSAVIQLFGDQSARLFSWINGVFIIIMCMGLAEKYSFDNTKKTITLALLATSTALMDLFGDGKIELASTLPIIAAIYWLVSANHSKLNQDYILVGIFSGFAMIARPYNVILLGVFLGIYFITSEEALSSRIRSFLRVSIPIAVLISAHLMLNWIILGDPLSPFNNTLRVNSNVWQWSFNPDSIWIFRIFYPIVVTFINTAQSLGNISPLIVMFLPMLLLKENRLCSSSPKSLIKISAITTAILFLWITVYFTVLEIRYVLFLWIIIYISLAERIGSSLERMSSIGKKLSQFAIIILLLFILIRNIAISVDAYAPINKKDIPQCGDFLFCNLLTPINEMASPGERVLTLNAYRYYLRPDLFTCSTKNIEYTEIKKASLVSNEAFWIEVRRQGYTYITYERNYTVRHLYMNFYPSPQNTPPWVQLEELEFEKEGAFVSYKINYIDPSYNIEKKCLKTDEIWLVQNVP